MTVLSTYIVAVTGTSGMIYFKHLLVALYRLGHTTYLVIDGPSIPFLYRELGWELAENPAIAEEQLSQLLGLPAHTTSLRMFSWQDVGALIASGSAKTDGMIVIPCSMATAGAIALGRSENLVERAADVILKERRQLLIVPRETPLSAIHLSNLLRLAELGVVVMPAMPAFHSNPEKLADLADYFVARLLDLLGEDNHLYNPLEG